MRVSVGEGIIYFVRDGCGNLFVFPCRSLVSINVVALRLARLVLGSVNHLHM